MEALNTKHAAATMRNYSRGPKEYALSFVMWELCVRIGRPGPPAELRCPRPYFKKYWTRMFPEVNDERSLLEVTEELEDSDDYSITNMTEEERKDMLMQIETENRQYKRSQQELEAEALVEEENE